MAAPATAPVVRRRKKAGPSKALQLVRQRLDDPTWQPTPEYRVIIPPARLPFDHFAPGALADDRCTYCAGRGIRIAGRPAKEEICKCVYRRIGRHCAREWLRVQEHPMVRPRVRRGLHHDMPRHEWAADFARLVERCLGREYLTVWLAFRIYQLNRSQIERMVGLDRGTMFHRLYEADEKIGRHVLWMTPHPLYPIRDYCNG